MKKYLITSREFYTDTPAVFRSILHQQLQEYLPEYALYRDKSNPNYDIQASHFVECCKGFEDIKSFIHQDIDLAKELDATGVHLTSTQIDLVKVAKSKNLEVIVSTHNKDEVLKAKSLGADAVTYSPIFETPNKGKPKGIENLKDIILECKDIDIFALGGVVTKEQIQMLEDTGVYGFASIRYFYNSL